MSEGIGEGISEERMDSEREQAKRRRPKVKGKGREGRRQDG
jgi:hypothetical protein